MTRKKMLIIDDNRTIRDLLAADFEDDFAVVTAINGIDGLLIALRSLPDVILLDINMPGLSGVDVVCELEIKSETRNIPVVVITASEHNIATERQLRPYRNVKGFLSKMTPTEEIKKTVRHALR